MLSLENNPVADKNRTLIVDDDNSFTDYTAAYLRTRQAKPLVVPSLQMAREALSLYQFDIILLDNQLDDGLGIDLFDDIHTLPNLPFVMMVTAEEDADFITQCFAKGAHDYIVKPVNMAVLWEKIQQLKDRASALHALQCTNQMLELMLKERDRESELANSVYSKMARIDESLPDGVAITQSANSATSSSVVFSLTKPNGNVLIFMADSSGQGLAAAICILPVVATARAMVKKGSSIQAIVHEINTKLYSEIPDDRHVFLVVIEFDFHANLLGVINAANADILIGDPQKCLSKVASKTDTLGCVAPQDFTAHADFIELDDCQEIAFFDRAFQSCMAKVTATPIDMICLAASQSLSTNSGWASLANTLLAPLESNGDSLLFCSINTDTLKQAFRTAQSKTELKQLRGKFAFELQLASDAIRSHDVIDIVSHFLHASPFSNDVKQRAFTVIAELVSNAIDHGILGIDSALKNDIEGFADYILQREDRLASLSDQDSLLIRLESECQGQLRCTVEDSGQGFEVGDGGPEVTQGLSGRGLKLINELCEQVTRNQRGNCTSVVITRT